MFVGMEPVGQVLVGTMSALAAQAAGVVTAMVMLLRPRPGKRTQQPNAGEAALLSRRLGALAGAHEHGVEGPWGRVPLAIVVDVGETYYDALMLATMLAAALTRVWRTLHMDPRITGVPRAVVMLVGGRAVTRGALECFGVAADGGLYGVEGAACIMKAATDSVEARLKVCDGSLQSAKAQQFACVVLTGGDGAHALVETLEAWLVHDTLDALTRRRTVNNVVHSPGGARLQLHIPFHPTGVQPG